MVEIVAVVLFGMNEKKREISPDYQDIPYPGDENARINLWLLNGLPPSNGQEVEVVIRKFEFVP